MSTATPPTTPPLAQQTTVGNYFVSNYPPFAYWKPDFVPDFLAVLERPPAPSPSPNFELPTSPAAPRPSDFGLRPSPFEPRPSDFAPRTSDFAPRTSDFAPRTSDFAPRTSDFAPPSLPPLGVYAHIPFCRKRCHFCYFKVYTDKDSQEIRAYLDALLKELTLYASKPFVGGRRPRFVYFGGGTPSYLSVEQLRFLTDGMKRLLPWDEVEEVTFECEPGTLTDHKLAALRAIGITRLSLGIEHFDDHILEINGRAHRSKEIVRAYGYAREVGFPQINIDLIAGMVEETEDKWKLAVAKTLELAPDSVTIYQMEVPFNTGIYQQMKAEGKLVAPVADWDTKRRWVDYAFQELERAGYTVGSAYTAVKDKARTRFVYRDYLWAGADLLSIGVASFGHLGGTHYQNHHDFEAYVAPLTEGRLPVYRALTPTEDERYLREFILQLKLGSVSADYFTRKFGEDPRVRFAGPLATLRDWGFLQNGGDRIAITRAGLLQVDRLLHEFFKPEHRGTRYA